MGLIRERGFKELVLVDDALRIMLDNISPVDSETVSVDNSVGRVLYSDIVAGDDVPPFDRAAMDGYAVRSIDVSGASPNNPIRLRVVGSATTSQPYIGVVNEFEAVRIDTGAQLPKGADAVVLLEDTEYNNGFIDVYRSVSKYSNVSVKGEDIKKGELLFRKGHFIHPVDAALLRTIGISEIEVYRRVRISLASVGSELVDVSEERREGGIYESNRVLVMGMLSRWPTEFVRSIIVGDDLNGLSEFVESSLLDSDIIVTTGGTSLGRGDLVTDYISRRGSVLLHGVALQPSKPVLFAIVDGKPFIGLPGYPVAAAISTYIFLVPVILKMAGVKGNLYPKVVEGRLRRRVASKLGTLQVVRCKVVKKGDSYLIEPIYASGAGVLSSLARGDGFLLIPENVEGYEEGSLVRVYLYRDVIEDGEGI